MDSETHAILEYANIDSEFEFIFSNGYKLKKCCRPKDVDFAATYQGYTFECNRISLSTIKEESDSYSDFLRKAKEITYFLSLLITNGYLLVKSDSDHPQGIGEKTRNLTGVQITENMCNEADLLLKKYIKHQEKDRVFTIIEYASKYKHEDSQSDSRNAANYLRIVMEKLFLSENERQKTKKLSGRASKFLKDDDYQIIMVDLYDIVSHVVHEGSMPESKIDDARDKAKSEGYDDKYAKIFEKFVEITKNIILNNEEPWNTPF